MTRLMKNILRGVGSIGTIYPSETKTEYKFMRQADISPDAALNKDMERIGGDFQKAVKILID